MPPSANYGALAVRLTQVVTSTARDPRRLTTDHRRLKPGDLRSVVKRERAPYQRQVTSGVRFEGTGQSEPERGIKKRTWAGPLILQGFKAGNGRGYAGTGAATARIWRTNVFVSSPLSR